MKTIKEKEALIKMSLVLGLEPDIDMVLEVAKQKKLLEDIKINGDDFIKALDQVVDQPEEKIEEVITVEEPEVVVEQVIEYPKPPSLDDIAHLIIEEETKEEVKEEPVALVETAPVPPSLDDLLEFHGIKEEEAPKNVLIDKAMNAITAQIKNEQVMTQEPKSEPTLNELQRKVKYLEQWISRIASTGPGSGEVNLRYLDDVDTSNLQNNYFLRYNSSNSKFEFTASSGTVANADIVSALTPGQNIGIDANGRITANVSSTSVSNATIVSALTAGQNISIAANGLITSNASGGGGTSNVDLTSVTSNIIPAADSTYNLGAPDKRFQTLYLANNTIDLGGTLISSDGTGVITISAQGAVLPSGSKINLDNQEKEIALVGNTGTVVHVVPFYTQELGLNTIAKNFEFGTDPDSYTFANFTLNNGTSISSTARAQFYF